MYVWVAYLKRWEKNACTEKKIWINLTFFVQWWSFLETAGQHQHQSRTLWCTKSCHRQPGPKRATNIGWEADTLTSEEIRVPQTLSNGDKPLILALKYPAASNKSTVSDNFTFCSSSSLVSTWWNERIVKTNTQAVKTFHSHVCYADSPNLSSSYGWSNTVRIYCSISLLKENSEQKITYF